MAIEIVSLPIKHGGSFHGKMLVHQRVHGLGVDVSWCIHRDPWIPMFHDRLLTHLLRDFGHCILHVSENTTAAAFSATESKLLSGFMMIYDDLWWFMMIYDLYLCTTESISSHWKNSSMLLPDKSGGPPLSLPSLESLECSVLKIPAADIPQPLYTCGFVWKCWVNIPNEIAIFHRDNDQQNHWVQWGTQHFQTNPSVLLCIRTVSSRPKPVLEAKGENLTPNRHRM